MTQQNVAAALFNSLLQLRDVAHQEAKNPVVQFLDFCAKSLARSNSQLFQDLLLFFAPRVAQRFFCGVWCNQRSDIEQQLFARKGIWLTGHIGRTRKKLACGVVEKPQGCN
jgi:hypothetical protein